MYSKGQTLSVSVRVFINTNVFKWGGRTSEGGSSFRGGSEKSYSISNKNEITWHVYSLRDSSDIQQFGEIILLSPNSQNHRQTDLLHVFGIT